MNKNVLLILCTALSTGALAADKEVEDLLAKMRVAYKNIGTATFRLESTLLAENGNLVLKMIGGFSSPNKMYVFIDSEDIHLKIISDGKRIYAVNDTVEQVADIPFSNLRLGQALSFANLEVLNFFDWEKQLSTSESANMSDSELSIRKNVDWNGKTWLVLEESAPQVGVYVEYYIDPESHLIWRTVQMTLDKKITRGDYILKALNRGAKVRDWRFRKPLWP